MLGQPLYCRDANRVAEPEERLLLAPFEAIVPGPHQPRAFARCEEPGIDSVALKSKEELPRTAPFGGSKAPC